MKKILIGHVFTNSKDNKVYFEHVDWKTGAVDYYLCQMKIASGKYRVKINSKNMVVSCWKVRKTFLSKLEVQKAFREMDKMDFDI